MKLHKKTAHQGEFLLCDKCDFRAIQKIDLKRHTVSKHGDRDDRPKYPCDQCDYVTIQKRHLKKHQKKKHENGVPENGVNFDANGELKRRPPQLESPRRLDETNDKIFPSHI